MRARWAWVILPVTLLVAVATGETPTMKHVDLVIRQHQGGLLRLTIGMAVVGFLLLVQGWVRLLRSSGRPMSHEEVATLMAPRQQFSVRRIRGKTTGVQADEGPDAAWTFRDMKIAWRSGAWWRDPACRSHFATTAGGLLTVVGLFGAIGVVSPPSVKLVIAAAIMYAVTRTTLTFWRA